MRRLHGARAFLAVSLAIGWGAALGGQTAPAAQGPSGSPRRELVEGRGPVSAAIGAEPSGQSATVTVVNRPIVVLSARVLGRSPAERADAAGRAVDDLVARGITGPVAWQSFDGGALMTVGSRGVLALVEPPCQSWCSRVA